MVHSKRKGKGIRHEDILREWRYSSTYSLTSALDGGERRSASRPGRFIPSERAPGTHWIGGWVGPTAILDAVVKRKIPSPHRESNPRISIVHPVAQRYTDWAIMAVPSKRPWRFKPYVAERWSSSNVRFNPLMNIRIIRWSMKRNIR
jgi:hypothetical protein